MLTSYCMYSKNIGRRKLTDTVFEYVQFIGQITSEESIFTYGPGESEATYSVPNHVPPFMDELLPTLLENETLVEVCGDNIECLFDFSETGDVEVGMSTVAVENEAMIESISACKYSMY